MKMEMGMGNGGQQPFLFSYQGGRESSPTTLDLHYRVRA